MRINFYCYNNVILNIVKNPGWILRAAPPLSGKNCTTQLFVIPAQAGIQPARLRPHVATQSLSTEASYERRRLNGYGWQTRTDCAERCLETWIPAFAGMTSFHGNNVNQKCSGQLCRAAQNNALCKW